MKVRAMILVLAALCLSSGVAFSQILYGNLVGNVTDPQQAAIVGAAVSIKNDATGYSAAAVTDDRGVYEIRNIPPGVYEIKVTAPGFATFEAKEITLQANNIARVDARDEDWEHQRSDHRRRGSSAAADRQVRYPLRYCVATVDAGCGVRLSQFPVVARPGSRRDALGVPERLHRFAGPRLDDQRQRYGAQLEQHAHRRRGQRLHVASAPRVLHSADGVDRDA